MIKKSKWQIIISLIVTLLPILVGLLLWDKLPDKMATHFDMNNQPNGWTGKEFAVFGIPIIMALLQVILIFCTHNDPKKTNIGVKAFSFVIWIIPACSLIVMLSCYGYALGYEIGVSTIAGLFVGILFIILGLLLPRNKQNYTFGYRCSWTLNDEGNWAYTNKVAGYCFIAGGILIIAVTLLKKPILMLPIIIIMALVPFAFSYHYYKTHVTGRNSNAENTTLKEDCELKENEK